MQKLSSFVEAGNTTLAITGAAGTISRKVQGSFPSATVTVFLSGTVTLAAIYADNALTPKANPFTASADGTWFFYAANGRYDVKFSGGGIAAPFTLGDFSLFDETTLIVDVTAAPFFASTVATAAANAAAFTAALASMSSGILFFPAGTYSTNGSLTPKTGVSFRGAGISATTINYSGSSYWLDVAANTEVDNVCFDNMTVNCSGSALGVLRVGRTTQTFDQFKMCQQWSLKNLFLHSPAIVSGMVGIIACQYIDWTLDNVTINNFEQPSIFAGGGNSTGTRVRFWAFRFGAKWSNKLNGIATGGGCQDVYACPEFLGPTTTGVAGVDYGYTVEIDATHMTFIDALYETEIGGKSQGMIHVTNAGGRFTDINGFIADAVGADASIVCDNGYDQPRFIGTNAGTVAAMSFGTTAGVGSQAEFIGCDSVINALAVAQPLTKITVIGSTSESVFRLNATGIQMDGATTINMGTDVTVNSKRGIFWNNDTNYGIFRPVGVWGQPLNINWGADISVDPGNSGPTGTMDVKRNGLRATGANGYLGITDTSGGAGNPVTGVIITCDIVAGKRRLYALFPTGGKIQIAIEP